MPGAFRDKHQAGSLNAVVFETIWDALTPAGATLGRLALASLLGGVIGSDRERSGKPAGLRTNMLICVGAALLMELSLRIGRAGTAAGGTADPARIAAQIVSGIGFLGAGAIIQSRGSVVGLTTAASMWVVAAIGMAVGAAEYVMSVAATVIVMITLMLLPRFETLLTPYPRVDQRIGVRLDPDPDAVGRVERILVDRGLTVEGLRVDRREDHFAVRYSTLGRERELDETVRALMAEPAVQQVEVD
jgi:putative Mg2+ transporter-C (MgtC) family protein